MVCTTLKQFATDKRFGWYHRVLQLIAADTMPLPKLVIHPKKRRGLYNTISLSAKRKDRGLSLPFHSYLERITFAYIGVIAFFILATFRHERGTVPRTSIFLIFSFTSFLHRHTLTVTLSISFLFLYGFTTLLGY